MLTLIKLTFVHKKPKFKPNFILFQKRHYINIKKINHLIKFINI